MKCRSFVFALVLFSLSLSGSVLADTLGNLSVVTLSPGQGRHQKTIGKAVCGRHWGVDRRYALRCSASPLGQVARQGFRRKRDG